MIKLFTGDREYVVNPNLIRSASWEYYKSESYNNRYNYILTVQFLHGESPLTIGFVNEDYCRAAFDKIASYEA